VIWPFCTTLSAILCSIFSTLKPGVVLFSTMNPFTWLPGAPSAAEFLSSLAALPALPVLLLALLQLSPSFALLLVQDLGLPRLPIIRHATTCCRTPDTIEICEGTVIARAGESPSEKQFDDLYYRNLLHAGRAEYHYSFAALNLSLRAEAANTAGQR
jgi:hypothetical protein